MKSNGLIAAFLLSLAGQQIGSAAPITASTPTPQASELIWNQDLLVGSALPIHRVETIEQQYGLFRFELTLDNRGNRTLIRFIRPFKAGLSIIDEAKALDAFLDVLTSNGINLSTIKSVWFPGGCEAEVDRRVLDEWMASKAWKAKVLTLDNTLVKSMAYREIVEVLQKHKLRTKSLGTDEVHFTRPHRVGGATEKIAVPSVWDVVIYIEPDAENTSLIH